jgi:hypothetical protein
MDRLLRVLCVVSGFGELLHDDDAVAKVIRAGGQHSVLSLWVASVPLLTNDSQIGANLRVYADEENRADIDQHG